MCGIAGYFSTATPLEPARLEAMRDALRHRGPDGAGARCWQHPSNGAGAPTFISAYRALLHRRLSIIDVSNAGAQPMANEDASCWISYNGEFYNFGEYRAPLEKTGHHFSSHCDTETILHLYEEYGIENTLARMNGMFAFALHDTQRARLFLARDRMGQKPLYYLLTPDGSLAFASEIKSLIAAGLVDTSRIDPVALDQFWTFGYTHGERTIYQQVKRLPPGHYAVWERGSFTVHEYWRNPVGTVDPDSRPSAVLVDQLEELLSDAVRLRLIADVPLGLFLSGGIDSALICALAARHDSSLCAYTVRFPDGADESAAAARIAEALGLRHRILEVDSSRTDRFEQLAAHFDQPFGDVSAIPTHAVCEATRAHAAVALTGDGGDELFAGYDDYREGLRLWAKPGQRPSPAHPRTPREHLSDFLLRRHGAGEGFIRWTRKFTSRHTRRFYAASFAATRSWESVAETKRGILRELTTSDPLSIMQALDQSSYLPDDILVKLDMMSMAVSLECRSPFMDYRVVEFAARLPTSLRMNTTGTGKIILRELLARHLPTAWFDAPKVGFTPPWMRWMRHTPASVWQTRWAALPSNTFRAEGGHYLFPDADNAVAAQSWNALSCMVFFERQAAMLRGKSLP